MRRFSAVGLFFLAGFFSSLMRILIVALFHPFEYNSQKVIRQIAVAEMRVKKKLWWGLIALSALTAVWMLAILTFKLHIYYFLDESTEAKDMKWSVVCEDASTYYLRGNYLYVVDGELLSGTQLLKRTEYSNEFQAKAVIAKMDGEAQLVYYAKSRPFKSSLERVFPYKECLHLLISLAIFAYFLWLQVYVKRVDHESLAAAGG